KEDDDWTSPEVWARANPNLGVSLKREFLEAVCKRALQSPRLENDFKRYHLNLWVEQAKRWFAMHRWADNTRSPMDGELRHKLRGGVVGRDCYGGLDLGSTDDITALVWCFPPRTAGERTIFLARFWVPENRVAERTLPSRPYDRWVQTGALETTPGNVTDYDF